MKSLFKKVHVFALAVLLGLTFTKASGQAMEEGNFGVNIYYGFPNFFNALIKNYADPDADAEAKSMGPIGGNFEYMVSDKFGIGMEVNYSTVSIEWRDTDSTTGVSTFTHKVSLNRTRIMPRFNIHFGSSENFDGYFGVAAGYLMTKYKYETNDPNGQDDEAPGLFPFAMRVALGGRYYFSDNIGLHVELGLGGGALVHGGLSFKF